MKRIYLDNASTTPVDEKVARAMQSYISINFGNSGSIHTEGVIAKRAVEDARKDIAKVLHTASDEIIFTSGTTEANNLAIGGIKKGHIITTVIEHLSVLEPIKRLEKYGLKVTYIKVSENGIINPEDVRKAFRKDTVLVSIMYANNEIGTIQPIKEISRIIREYRRENSSQYPYFHTDAGQAVGMLPIMMDSLGVDMASFGAHKFYGPKGVGFLYVNRRITRFNRAYAVEPRRGLFGQIHGGNQEDGMRAGTLNVAGIVGMSVALLEAEKRREREVKRVSVLRDFLISKFLELSGVIINGDKNLRLASNINVSFPFVEGEQMVIELDARGVACSTGSACTTEKSGPSHVILALQAVAPPMGGTTAKSARALNAVRFSLGRSTTKKDLQYVVRFITQVVAKQKKFVL